MPTGKCKIRASICCYFPSTVSSTPAICDSGIQRERKHLPGKGGCKHSKHTFNTHPLTSYKPDLSLAVLHTHSTPTLDVVYSHCIPAGAVLQQQLHDGLVAVPGGVVQGGVVLVARGVHQCPVLQQQFHHVPVPVVTRLVLGGKGTGEIQGEHCSQQGSSQGSSLAWSKASHSWQEQTWEPSTDKRNWEELNKGQLCANQTTGREQNPPDYRLSRSILQERKKSWLKRSFCLFSVIQSSNFFTSLLDVFPNHWGY